MTGAPVHPGDVLAGKFRVERVLGVGGMGVVVAATHLQLGQQVALKFMLAEALAQPAAAERFLREARAAVRLRSQHVARIQDVGTLDNGAPYIVMELLEGQDLQHVLAQQGPLPPTTAVDFMLQACDAIAEAHASGIVHRDLKPGNLFVTAAASGAPLVKVLDFGIAKATDPAVASMTQTSAVFGSPAYMSPEQLRSSKGVDARADIWSLGIILYEVLAGHVPFQGETITELGLKVVMDPLPPLPRIAGMKPGLEAAIYRCLEKDPAARFQSVGELAAALAPFASPSARAIAQSIGGFAPVPPAARKASSAAPWWIAGVIFVAAAGTGVAVAVRGGGGGVSDAPAAATRTPDARVVAAAPAGKPDARPVAAASPPDAAPLAALAGAADAGDDTAPPPAPWAALDPLEPSEVPAVFTAQWRKAENRAKCPLLVPTSFGAAEGAKPRAATFYGGWAIAYDKKGLPGTAGDGNDCATCGRSAFGVAGTGVDKDGTSPFPNVIDFADGSRVSFGLEGGKGPHVLAYLTTPDAACLYNVWSALGPEHLLEVIAGLRRVQAAH